MTATYSRLGRIEYSPRPLFKIVLYGCSRGIFKTREIERACRENVNFMYLLERHPAPEHNTIARFRKDHLPYAVKDLLIQMVKLLVACGEISFALFKSRALYFWGCLTALVRQPPNYVVYSSLDFITAFVMMSTH